MPATNSPLPSPLTVLIDVSSGGPRGKVDKAGLQIVGLLTKDPDEPKEDYYERIRQHEPARRVKLLGDIASDTDPPV
jgi:hypothetical protein